MFNDYVFLDEEKVTKFYDSTIGYKVRETIKRPEKVVMLKIIYRILKWVQVDKLER